MDQHRALLYAIIIQHLEADGLELVSTIIADEFVSQFGPDQFAELEQAQSSEIIDGLADTNQTALLRLLTAYQQGENPTPPPPPPNVALPTPPQPKLVIQISTPSQKTKNGQKRNRGRRRSTMVISPSDRSRKPEQPLEPREVPDLLALQTDGEIATDEHGVVRGGTPLALLRWACRCAWMTHEKKEEEATIAQCETDLVAYLITFTDFTTPEDLVAGLETILSQHPNEAWGLQQFLVRWLEYDFDQLPIRTRRCLIEDIIEVALMCVHVTHQDTDGNDVDVAHVSKIRVVNALPPELMEALQTVESKLCVDDRGGARTPSHSMGEAGGTNTPVHGRSPSHSVSSVGSIGLSPRSSPRSNRKHLTVGGSNGSPRSRSVSNSNSSSGGTSLEIFDYPVQVVAEQLTYVDASMFRKIPSLEFLNKSWDRNRYENVAEYTWHFTDRWNGMVEYLATLVLHGDGPEQRASRLEYLIDLGDVLWKTYHNFQSASMINMALEHLSLKTLKNTWERVQMKYVNDSTGPIPPNKTGQTIKDRLKQVFWHENNYKNYLIIESRIPSNEPIIPSMMVHHKYLFDTHEGAPHLICPICETFNMKDADVCCKSRCKAPLDLNYRSFSRARNLAGFIKKLTRCQRMSYNNITPNREICNMISKGVQPHIMYFDKHTRTATTKMLAAGKALGATESKQ